MRDDTTPATDNGLGRRRPEDTAKQKEEKGNAQSLFNSGDMKDKKLCEGGEKGKTK